MNYITETTTRFAHRLRGEWPFFSFLLSGGDLPQLVRTWGNRALIFFFPMVENRLASSSARSNKRAKCRLKMACGIFMRQRICPFLLDAVRASLSYLESCQADYVRSNPFWLIHSQLNAVKYVIGKSRPPQTHCVIICKAVGIIRR
jgi:hypothetical protein